MRNRSKNVIVLPKQLGHLNEAKSPNNPNNVVENYWKTGKLAECMMGKTQPKNRMQGFRPKQPV